LTSSVKDRDNKRPREIEISKKLLEFPVGHHYLVLYSDLGKMHRVYSEYVRGQLEAQPNSVIIILPFYDSTEKVREVLQSNSIDFTKLERQGALFIIDIVKVISNPYYTVPDIERLRAFVRQVVDQHPETTTFAIADMSVFHMMRKPSELLRYERTLHKDLKVEKWKELCFYHEHDFKIMFTEEQANELLEYHKDRVITI
jgi:KaiC/GvpD/RAD55 family RecA-like ATPase